MLTINLHPTKPPRGNAGAHLILGPLCDKGHDYKCTDSSLRYPNGSQPCVECLRERAQTKEYLERDATRKREAYKRGELWQQRNPEAQLEAGRKHASKPEIKERTLAYQRKRRAENPKVAVTNRLRCRLRDARQRYLNGLPLPKSRSELVDYDAIFEHIGPCPGGPADWHIDHIKPLCKFDLTDPEQVREAFAPDNHRWLEARPNQRRPRKHWKEGDG